MDLTSALESAQRDRAAALGKRDRLDAEIADLDVIIRGLELALKRSGSTASETLEFEERDSDWSDMQRTDAVVRALTEIGRPVGPADVTKYLHRHGRDDERDLVAASIAYLKNQRRVHSKGYGQWVPGPPPDEDFDPDDGGAP